MFKGSKEFNKDNNKAIWDVLQSVGTDYLILVFSLIFLTLYLC